MRMLFALLFTFAVLFANGVGNYIVKESSGIEIELGRDPLQPIAGERTTLSVSAHKEEIPISADAVWIKISKDDKTYFSSSDFRLRNDGPIFFIFTFPEGGDYNITISFMHENKKIQSDFSIEVKEATVDLSLILLLIVTFLLGLITFKIFARI